MYDLTNFQVGDEFETSPHELGVIISAILAEGGTFSYEGNSVTIKSLPNRQDPVIEAPAPVVEEPTPVIEVPAPAVEPVIEELVVKVTEPKVEVAPKTAPRPKKRY